MFHICIRKSDIQLIVFQHHYLLELTVGKKN